MDKSLHEQVDLIERITGKNKGALNTSEVSRMLGVSCSTIDAWRKQSVGPSYLKIGNSAKSRVLYPTIELAHWMLNNMVKTA